MELSTPVRRFAAIALIFFAIILAWWVVAAPLLDAHQATVETIERLRPVLEHRRAAVRDLATLGAELKRLEARGVAASGLLDAANDSISAAQVQDRLKRSVDNVSGDLKSTQVLPARDDAGFRRVTVRTDLAVSITALQRLLYDLEASEQPYLFVDNLEVSRRTENRGNKSAPAESLLEVRFDVYGYMRKSI